MKVAVTGATGFIGRHVVAELAHRSVDIIAAVRPSTTDLPALSKGQYVRLDLMSAQPSAFDLLGRPDVLIHLAWGGLPNYKSLHHFERELPAQYHFLKVLVESGLKAVVITGTCFEYGMQCGSLNEGMETRPTNSYGLAKDTLRRQLECLKAVRPFELTWTRLFYLYGEGQAESALLPQLRRSVERGEKIFNMSGGEQLRDYMPVSEVAKQLVVLALEKRDIGVVNLCSGRPVSVRKLVEGWIEEYGWSINLRFGHYPYPDYEPMAFWGDRRKLDDSLRSR